MSTSTPSTQKNAARVLFAALFVASVALVTVAGAPKVGSAETTHCHAGVEASLMPFRMKSGQKPAPVTWSARFNIRWEARWSGEGKYMV
jgi:hypothetical protein